MRKELVERLSSTDFHTGNSDPVRHLSTPLADLFFTGFHAYKIFKPVDLGFVDLGKVGKRKKSIAEAYRINQRIAPALYQGVTAITQEKDGEFALDGSGEPVEWALRMARFPQKDLFNHMLAEHRVTPAHIDFLGKLVAQMHIGAEKPKDQKTFGTAKVIRKAAERCFEDLKDYRDVTIPSKLWKHLKNWTITTLTSHKKLFKRRLDQKRICAIHGDLHLRNICIHQEEPTLFNGVALDETLRFGDPATDWAYLTMDLTARGHPGLANRFLNRYLEFSDDYEGLCLAHFYQAYRALTRGLSASLMLESCEVEEERRPWILKARRYFDLAKSFTASRRPGLVLMTGLSGSGKTRTAEKIAAASGAVVIRSDALRKHLAGLPPDEPAPANPEAGVYTHQMMEKTYEGMLERAVKVTRAGFWAILDGTYLTEKHRGAVIQVARKRRLSILMVHTVCPEPVILRNLQKRPAQGREAPVSNQAALNGQKTKFQAPGPQEADALFKLNTGGYPNLQPILQGMKGALPDRKR